MKRLSKPQPCGCGQTTSTQPLDDCFFCEECDQACHSQYDILAHFGHSKRPLLKLEFPVKP